MILWSWVHPVRGAANMTERSWTLKLSVRRLKARSQKALILCVWNGQAMSIYYAVYGSTFCSICSARIKRYSYKCVLVVKPHAGGNLGTQLNIDKQTQAKAWLCGTVDYWSFSSNGKKIQVKFQMIVKALVILLELQHCAQCTVVGRIYLTCPIMFLTYVMWLEVISEIYFSDVSYLVWPLHSRCVITDLEHKWGEHRLPSYRSDSMPEIQVKHRWNNGLPVLLLSHLFIHVEVESWGWLARSQRVHICIVEVRYNTRLPVLDTAIKELRLKGR